MGFMNRLFKKLVVLTEDDHSHIEGKQKSDVEASDSVEPAKDAHTAMKYIANDLNKISDYFDEHPDEEEEFMKKLKDI